MAKARMVAKSLSTSQRYARLYEVAGKRAEFCQAMFPLLVAHADDFGRLAGDEFTVKHMVVPTSPRKEADITEALKALHAVGLIEWYQVNDRKCIQIQNFEAHQSGLHRRTRSEFPDSSGKFPEIPSELNRTEQNGREQNRTAGGAPLHSQREHRNHYACGRVCLPAFLHQEFAKRRGNVEELEAFYTAVLREWSIDGPRSADEPGEPVRFWRARYDEKWPAVAPVKASAVSPRDRWRPSEKAS